MIISFSVFKEKIESGEKKQTIRKYSEKRYKQFCNAKKYQLYWGSPRNGGTLIKEVELERFPQIIRFMQRDSYVGIKRRFKRVLNCIIDEETGESVPMFSLAKADGFDNDFDMWDWFFEKYYDRMFSEKFMVIRWK
jgi:hypothetical protein